MPPQPSLPDRLLAPLQRLLDRLEAHFRVREVVVDLQLDDHGDPTGVTLSFQEGAQVVSHWIPRRCLVEAASRLRMAQGPATYPLSLTIRFWDDPYQATPTEIPVPRWAVDDAAALLAQAVAHVDRLMAEARQFPALRG